VIQFINNRRTEFPLTRRQKEGDMLKCKRRVVPVQVALPIRVKKYFSTDAHFLILAAGLMWIGIGILLLTFSYSWLNSYHEKDAFIFALTGVVFALIIHHFGFLKIADLNLKRISVMKGKKSIFYFMTLKSYLIAVVMVTMGFILRHSSIPKPYLAVLYTGIGLSLILSSIRYLRRFMNALRNGV
jgi:hypothetical protein